MTKDQANTMRLLDEAAGTIASTVPLLYRALYEGFVRQGFTQDQAIDLTKHYITENALVKGDDDERAA